MAITFTPVDEKGAPLQVSTPDAPKVETPAVTFTPAAEPTAMDRVRNAAGTVRDTATGLVAKGVQNPSPVDWAQAGLSKLTGGRVPMPSPLMSEDTAKEVAKVIVPQTGAQLGADVALSLIPGGKIAKLAKVAEAGPVMSRVLPAAARVAGATAGGATGAALAGDDAVAGGTMGGIGALLGEGGTAAVTRGPQVLGRVGRRVGEKTGLLPPAEKASTQAAKTLADVTTQMVRGTQASQEAARVGQAMGGLFKQAGVPGMATKTQDELYQLARTGKGKDTLDKMFGQAKDAITERLKGKKLYIPEFGSESATRPSVILGPKGEPIAQRTMRKGLLTLDEALTELQNAGKGISQQVGLQRSRTAGQATLRYGEARAALIKAVASVDKQAAQTLDRALTGYRQGRAYIGLVEKSLDKSGRLDPEKLTANVNKSAEKLKRSFGERWDQAQQALLPPTPGVPGGGVRRVPAPMPPPFKAQPPVPSPLKPAPSVRPGVQTGIDAAMQSPALMLPGLGAASMLAGPILRHTPGVRGLHMDQMLDTMAEGF